MDEADTAHNPDNFTAASTSLSRNAAHQEGNSARQRVVFGGGAVNMAGGGERSAAHNEPRRAVFVCACVCSYEPSDRSTPV
jgi:hypothetical protein